MENHNIEEQLKRKVLEFKKKLNYAQVELDIQKNHFQRLDDFSRLLNSQLDMGILLQVLIQNLKEILNFDHGLVFVKDSNGEYYNYKKLHTDFYSRNINNKKLQEIFEKIDENKQAILTIDINEDQIYGNIFEKDFNSWMAFPIIYNKKVSAIIILLSELKGVFTKQEKEVAESLANQAGIALENANLFTQYKKKNLELELTLDKLKEAQNQIISSEKIAAAGRLATGMARSINDPLTGMLTSIQMLKSDILVIEDQELKNEIFENIQILDEGAKKIRGIVSKLLAINNTQNSTDEKLPLSDAIDIAKNVIYEGIDDPEIVVEQNYDTDYYLTKNFSEIIKLITIILYNSKEALLNSDKKNRKIKIKIYEKNGKKILEIEDNGIGMTENILSQIFEPFFTTKNDTKNLGVGLYIGYDIAKKNFKNMSISSKSGEGTTVKIDLN